MTISNEAQDLVQFQTALGVEASRIRIFYKQHKVTIDCRIRGRSYGVRGLTLTEALSSLHACLQARLTK